MNVSKQTLYKYENNIITNIPFDKIETAAKIGNVSPSYLMGWESTTSCEYDISTLKKYTLNEQDLLDSFNKLNFKGEEEALKRVRELTFVPEYTSDKEEL